MRAQTLLKKRRAIRKHEEGDALKKLFALLIASAFLFFGCASQGAQMAGNDRDAHGCIGSAGYSWCEAKQTCLRPWEVQCESLQIYTEDFPPYNYLDANGSVAGKSTEVVRKILARLNQTSDITLATLSEGYSRALSGPNVAIYSLGRTLERESKFKWAGPIGVWELTLYAQNNSALASSFAAAQDDSARTALAKSAPSICVVKDDVRHQYLLAHNFTNIVAVEGDGTCAQKLASGNASLWFGSSTSFSQIVSEAGLSSSSFAPVQSVQKNALYIAFSRDVPDSTVAAWQAALDAMKASGTFGS